MTLFKYFHIKKRQIALAIALLFTINTVYAWGFGSLLDLLPWGGSSSGSGGTSVVVINQNTVNVAESYVKSFESVSVSFQDVHDFIQEGVIDVLTKGINYIGLGFVAEEAFYQAYKKIVDSQLQDKSYSISANQYFKSDFVEQYQSFFDAPLQDIKFRVFNGGWFGTKAVTDCKTIYLPENSRIHWLVSGYIPFGTDDSAWKWLLHEMKHANQCSDLGSRKAYGVYWFENLISVGVISFQELMLGTFFLDPIDFHDDMPMEKDAESYANKIVKGSGFLINKPSSTKLVSRSSQRAVITSVVTGGLLN